MRTAIRRILLATFVACMFGGTSSSSCANAADGYRPLLVVSVASYEKLLNGVNSVADPRLTALALALIQQHLQIPSNPATRAPMGLDVRRPWGLVVETDGQTFPAYGFLPVTDVRQLLASAVASGKIKPPVQGVYEIEVSGQTWYVTQKGNWTMFANTRRGLATAPAEPAKVLGGLTSYDIAARVSLKDLPAEVRKAAGQWLRDGHRLRLAREAGQSELGYAVESALANEGLQLAASLADEGDAFLLGVSLNPRTRSLAFDLATTARPDTSAAVSLNAPHRTQTEFAGFLATRAMLTGVWTGEIARMPLHRLLSLVATVAGQLAPGDGNPAAELFSAVRQALMEESVDGGVAAAVRSNGVTVVVGGSVADGPGLQRKLNELVENTRKQGPASAAVWKLDAGVCQEIRLHTLSVPIPKDAKDRAKLTGLLSDTVELTVGIGDRRLFFGAGKNSLAAVKRVIQDSRPRSLKGQSPVQFSLALGALARFLAEIDDQGDRSRAGRLAALLDQAGGKDHLRLTARPVERGTHARLEIEEGVLRAIGSLPLAGAGGLGPGPAAPRRPRAPAR